MITVEMESVYLKLQALKPFVEQNHAKAWIAFQVWAPRGKRNAVTVRREGVKFFTEDQQLLDDLSRFGIVSHKIMPDEGPSKLRHMFPNLTAEDIDAHPAEFKKLLEDSVALKKHYS